MSTSGGGKPNVKPLPYVTPKGPTDQMHKGPGLGGANHGNTQKSDCGLGSGSPGIGGTNHGNKGSQN